MEYLLLLGQQLNTWLGAAQHLFASNSDLGLLLGQQFSVWVAEAQHLFAVNSNLGLLLGLNLIVWGARAIVQRETSHVKQELARQRVPIPSPRRSPSAYRPK